MTKKIFFSVADFDDACYRLASDIKLRGIKYQAIYGVPRGGVAIAIRLSSLLDLPIVDEYSTTSKEKILVVDDIVDSGKTRSKFSNRDFACIHINMKHCDDNNIPNYFVFSTVDWIEYWWEANELPAINNIVRLLEYIGENPNREGLIETPDRVIKSYDFLFSGYKKDPKDIVKTFDSDGYDELVLLKDIEMYSMCEHHMLPFIGKAHVAYIPRRRVVGISKLARLVEIFSRRLQIQERLTNQITQSLMDLIDPIGAACIIEAEHLCMKMRGVQKQNSTMITTSLKGIFIDDCDKGRAARQELMSRIK